MSSLKGRYEQKVDEKGRMAFSAKLREKLGDNLVITKGLDGCLFVYSAEEWEKFEETLKAQRLSSRDGRKVQRHFCGNAQDIECDKQGRIVIPAFLRSYAEIGDTALVLGAGTRVEIWDKAAYEEFEDDELSDTQVEDLMDNLDF